MIVTINNQAQLQEFIDLPQALYKKDANWVKPLVGSHPSEFTTAAHPVLKHCKFQLYLAVDNTVPVGRMAVFTDNRYNAINKERTGFFGFFECINNQNTANQLFSAARDFAQRNRLQKIIGPVDLSTNYQAGVLVDGFTCPTVMTPYNKNYYAKLIESAGYHKLIDLYAYDFGPELPMPERANRMAALIAKKYPGLLLKHLADTSNLNRTGILMSLHNEAFADNWGFVPITSGEARHLLKSVDAFGYSAPNYIAVLNKKPVGLVLTVPDLYSPIGTGQTTDNVGLGQQYRKLRCTVLGVIPAYRKRGIETVLGIRMLQEAREAGYERVEFSVILETNSLMNNIVKREMGLPVSKTFRVYEKVL